MSTPRRKATSTPATTGRAARKQSAQHEPEASAARIRVLCVDDHALLVEGLKAQFAIEGRVQIVGRLPSPERLLEEVERLKPDVVLLDIEMPGPDVFEAADRMHHVHPDLRFVFLSAYIRDGYLAAAYRCGASGYFAKGDDLEEIVAGVEELARSPRGAFVMGRKVRQRFAQGAAPSPTSRPAPLRATPQEGGPPTTLLASLTDREVEVLRLIGKGMSRVEIATELSRSPKTVDGHQERMMKKLGVDSRADLMRFAIREGLAEA